MTSTITVTNNTTRILTVYLPRPKGVPKEAERVRLRFLPGSNEVPSKDWDVAREIRTIMNWGELGSLRNRTGGFIKNMAMLSVDAVAPTAPAY